MRIKTKSFKNFDMKEPALLGGTVIIANELKTKDKNLMKISQRKQKKTK